MINKRAILQVADTGPLESLVIMLRSVGFQCYLPNRLLLDRLKHIGCDTIIDIKTLVDHWGYDRPMSLPEAGPSDVNDKDVVWCDIKAHRNAPRIEKEWPKLKGRVIWYRINGGEPEHVIKNGEDFGDETNPPCAGILTPNRWYEGHPRAFSCWPPFYRADEYNWTRDQPHFHEPLCLIHNLTGWGYGALVDNVRKL